MAKSTDVKQILVVHGLDNAMKDDVVATIEKLGFTAVVVHDQPAGSELIACDDAAMAIVLYGDDEVGTSRVSFPKNVTIKPQPKVMFESGFLVGKMGADKVFVLYHQAQNYQLPFEPAQLPHYPYDNQGRWQLDLARALKAQGFEIDANKLI